MGLRVTLISGHEKNWHAGASTVYLHLDEELRGRGLSVRLLHRSDYAAEPAGPTEKFLLGRRLRDKVRDEVAGCDVVEVAGNLGGPLFAALPGPDAGPLRVARLHGLEFKDEQARVDEAIAGQLALPWTYRLVSRHVANWQERRTLTAADLVICHSSREADAIVVAGWKSESDVVVMPLGVDPRFFADRPAAGGTGGRLLWWGSWVERKGISSLPRAFELACRERPDLTLTVGGSGAPADGVLAAFPPAVRARVNVLGFASPQEHVDQLLSHDIFVFPSLSEGFGLALLEAMAAGLPTVTTNTGMAHDWLEHGQNCLIAPMSAPTTVSRLIVRLAGNPALRSRIGADARRTAQGLTWANLGRRTLDAYEECLARKRGGAGRRGPASVAER